MRVVLQRVSKAACWVGDEKVAEIGRGILLLVGIEKGDTMEAIEYIANKCANLRIFEDSAGKMNLNVIDIGGEALAISQFTLAANIRKGRRPSFDNAMPPDQAIQLYERFVDTLNQYVPTKKGVFGAKMAIELINDGPVTFVLER
ncbi:D-tyrosyl-tRNA(Tyr) deacylase [candidate division WOR-3 bacterium]|nr:D-tyrosyl-tRNA(Tyr) deacylase [candidate division WOR-3 bacterium]